jgi:hypothetical protein
MKSPWEDTPMTDEEREARLDAIAATLFLSCDSSVAERIMPNGKRLADCTREELRSMLDQLETDIGMFG